MLQKQRVVFFVILLGCFLAGAYFWKIGHTGAFFWRSDGDTDGAEELDFTVHVGDYLVTRDEVEWEYRLYINQLYMPEIGSMAESKPLDTEKPLDMTMPKNPKPILELYNKVLADLIERKLLYQYLSSDDKFTLQEPGRYSSCIEEWTTTMKRLGSLIRTEKERNHLKSMLCEKSILMQYVKDRVNPSVTVSEEEAKQYYADHRTEFVEPARVVVRQIVLGNEEEAKKLKEKVSVHNFASMARDLSIAPEAKEGGILKPFAKGEMPSVFDIAFEMKPGTVQGILKSTYGFHLLMLEKKVPKTELSYEAAKPKIIKNLTQKRQEEVYQKWVETALNTIPIKSSRAF